MGDDPDLPKLLKDQPWYAPESTEPAPEELKSQWQAKRDAWESYDTCKYKDVIDNFEVKQAKKRQRLERKEQEDPSEKIVDKYSRSVARPSYRNLKDTAHYLLDQPNTDSFKRSATIDNSAQAKSDSRADTELPENVYLKNHSSIFGSWYHKGRWGFRCCHQLNPDSSCTTNSTN